jgi:RNA 3'-terminal phosphate cyclase (ATP)
MKPIQIDGTSGGGQMLRTALTLAMVTGQPFRMTHIRGKRTKPGLMRQHLTCVKAACEISGGTADGAEIGSTEIVFRAGKLLGSSYQFAIGTAGSATLLLQTLLPALLFADRESTLRLEGGTHNPMAPPFEFIDRVYLPALRRMGVAAEVSLVQAGFAPAGGGILEAVVKPCAQLSRIDLHDRGALKSETLSVLIRNLKTDIAERMLEAAQKQHPCADARIEVAEPGPGRGVSCHFHAEFEHSAELASACGEVGVTADRVGTRVGKSMKHFHSSGAAVGRHLADQLLLPMALAGGGSFTTSIPDNHVLTNLSVIEKFLPVRSSITELDRGLRRVSLTPGPSFTASAPL